MPFNSFAKKYIIINSKLEPAQKSLFFQKSLIRRRQEQGMFNLKVRSLLFCKCDMLSIVEATVSKTRITQYLAFTCRD